MRKRIWIPLVVQVTQALMDKGFTPTEIRAVMGGNALRVIRPGLLPYAAWQAQRRAQGQAHR